MGFCAAMTWPDYDPLTAAWNWLHSLAGMLTDPAVLKEVKRLTRAALAEQLQGRALKTRELYRVRREA